MKIVWVKMCNTYTGQYSGKDYGFKAVDDIYEVGDFVVVDAANLLQVAKVAKVDDWAPESIPSWFIRKLKETYNIGNAGCLALELSALEREREKNHHKTHVLCQFLCFLVLIFLGGFGL